MVAGCCKNGIVYNENKAYVKNKMLSGLACLRSSLVIFGMLVLMPWSEFIYYIFLCR